MNVPISKTQNILKELADNILLLRLNELAFAQGLIGEATKIRIHNIISAQISSLNLLNNRAV